MRSPRSSIAIAALFAGSGAVSCAAILGFERLSTEDGFVIPDSSSTDGTTEEAATQVEAGPDASPCNDLGLPPEPSDAGGGGPPVIVAVNLLDFGVDDAGGIISVPGFNLDRTCSVDLASSSCTTTGVLEPGFAKYAKDKSATGLDNAGIGLIQYITKLPSTLLTSDSINAGIANGKYGATVRISDWNGAPNDSEVQVELFPAIGLLRPDPDAGFGPNDVWVLDKRFQVTTFESSTVKSDRAYVSDGKLVARFGSATLPILLDRDPKPFDIHLTDAIVVGTLASSDAGTALSGASVAGRWKTADFLGQVRTIYIKDANGIVNKVICDDAVETQFLYGIVRNEICSARDLRGDSKDGQQLGCDAVSAAMRIESYPVNTIGVFDAGPDIDARCTDPNASPLNDCSSN